MKRSKLILEILNLASGFVTSLVLLREKLKKDSAAFAKCLTCGVDMKVGDKIVLRMVIGKEEGQEVYHEACVGLMEDGPDDPDSP